jgi:hypothetical protein
MQLIKDYPLLDTIGSAVKIACVDWRDLKNILLKLPHDNSPDVTWFSVSKINNNKYFSPNNGPSELRPEGECITIPGSDWLVITFFDNGWSPETTLNSIIAEKFSQFITDVKKLPGVVSATIHFLGHGVDIPTHTDGDNNHFYTVIGTIETPPTSIYLRVGEATMVPHTQSVFVFDSTIPHGVTNTSGGDWIYFVLRIEQGYFE